MQVDEKPESRDPRSSRDPRRKGPSNEKKDVKVEKKSEVNTSRDPESKSKKDRSPSGKSTKSDSKKSSSSSKSTSSSSKSSSKSNSKSSSKAKEEAPFKPDSRKRVRENELSPASGSPKEKEGRISPLPPPVHGLGRIPKVKRGSSELQESQGDKKRGKRGGSGGKVSPIPEKKSKPLFIE